MYGGNSNKVMIVGAGSVGMSYAYALLNQRTHTDEVVLVDIDEAKVAGEVMDLQDGLGFSPGNLKIRAGRYEDASDVDLVVITAGARQVEGETRMDLLRKNAGILQPMVEQIVKAGFGGIFLVVSNPVDVMTYLVQKYSGFSPSRVIGSGTVLDSSRLMYAVGHLLQINPKNFDGYILGEHGDSEFAVWSLADIGGREVREFLGESKLDEIENEVRNQAYEIIEKKGATFYGIGMCLAWITEVIFSNALSVLTVSNWDEMGGVYYGYPAVLGRDGVVKRVGLKLSEAEQDKLDRSIAAIREAIAEATD